MEASYLKAHGGRVLRERLEAAWRRLAACDLCPRACDVDRTKGERGFCRTGSRAKLASFNPHFGEEAPLVGSRGSGTIFFSNCNLGCLFCQNEDISLGGHGQEVEPEELAAVMLSLQEAGCHNINFVTPTHVVAQILAALVPAVEGGLRIPLVYNCGGYESVETIRLLDGIVDIYMPDFKFGRPEQAASFCQAPDYPRRAQEAIAEMHRQVGDLVLDQDGLAQRGLLVRHLVLPDDLAGTGEVVDFLARLSPRTYLNVMAQYRPCARAPQHPPLDRPIRAEEHREAVKAAFKSGLTRLDKRRPMGLRWIR
jgi:putative pyruvate formate lyase activating enzyme